MLTLPEMVGFFMLAAGYSAGWLIFQTTKKGFSFG
jgi:hypothetical protein